MAFMFVFFSTVICAVVLAPIDLNAERGKHTTSLVVRIVPPDQSEAQGVDNAKAWQIPAELLAAKTIHVEMSKPKNETTWKKQRAVLKKLQKKILKMKFGWQITADAGNANLILVFKHWVPEGVTERESSYEQGLYCPYVQEPGVAIWYTIVQILSPQTREVLWEGGDCCSLYHDGLLAACANPDRGIGNTLKELAKTLRRHRKRH